MKSLLPRHRSLRRAAPHRDTPPSRRPTSRWPALLERFIPAHQREFLVGDLIEEFQRRLEEEGSWRARRWLCGQLVGLVRHGWIEIPALSDRKQERAMPTPFTSQLREASQTTVRDLQIATRRWLGSPASAAVVIATLTLGIGLNTLVFMLADLVLFRPAGFVEPSRLISLETNTGGSGWYGSSEPELVDIEKLSVFETIGAWTGGSVPLESELGNRRLQLAQVTEHMLPLLGVQPMMGRFPDAKEGLPGADPVIVLSHDLWLKELGGRQDVLGKALRLNGRATEIIGVMPAGFVFPISQVTGWMPLPFDPDDLWGRNNHYLNVIGRLAPGTELEEAAAAVSVLAGQSATAYPEHYSEHGYRTQIQPLRQAQTANERLPMLVLLGSVGLLLLLTCANVANVQLGRGAARQREIAVRRALGASKQRLVAELMADSFVVASVGGLCAVGLALVGSRLMPIYLPESLLRFGEPQLDLRVLGFTLTLTVLTTLIFGLWPAFRSLDNKDGGSVASTARFSGQSRWLRSALVVGQMTLASVLLIGCGMTVRSLLNLVDVNPGFSADGVLTLDAAVPATVLDTPEKVVAYYRTLEDELIRMPGVSAAGSMARLPMTGTGNIWSIEIEGRPASNIGEAPAAQVQQATPGMFEVLGIPLLSGRLIAPSDTASAEPVVVINEAFAREFWRGEDPIGKRFRVYSDGAPFMRVVGVVASLRDGRLDQEGLSQWYVPHAQAFQTAYHSPRNMQVVVKTHLATPTDLAPAILTRLREINPGVPVVDPNTLLDTVAGSLALPRQLALWLAVFAGVALLLAGLGLYGVLSFLVTVRKSEIGIRIALGATPRHILNRIVGEGLILCALGLALGVTIGTALSQVATSLFFEVQSLDPGALGATCLMLLTMGWLAPLAPAFRASRTDPCESLRAE